MEAIIGVIIGFVAFGAVWFFLIKPKNNQSPTEEIKLKEEELKETQINLATRDAELKAAQDAKLDLEVQLSDKKKEVKDLYVKVDEITKGVGEYKLISEKALNKHDVFGTKVKNW